MAQVLGSLTLTWETQAEVLTSAGYCGLCGSEPTAESGCVSVCLSVFQIKKKTKNSHLEETTSIHIRFKYGKDIEMIQPIR